MYNDNNRKLRMILLVLAIVLVLLRIVKTAKAEGIESYAEDYLDEYIDTYFPSEVVSIYEQNKQYYYSFVTYTIDNNAHVVDILPIPNSGITLYREGYNDLDTYSMGVSCYTNRKSYRNAIYTPDNVTNLTLPVYGFRFVAHSSGIGVGRTSVSLSNSFNDWQQFGFNWLVGPEGSNANCFSMLYTFGQYNYTSSSPVISDIVGYAPEGSDVYCNFSKVTTFVPSYTDDSRLKFWTYDNLDGSKTLVTSLDAFCVDSIFVQNDFSNIVLTYELDNTEHIVSIDSSNSVIRSTQNQNGGNITYKLETPFSVFGFDNNTVSFKITKCDFTYIKTTMGNVDSTAYKISCNYLAYSRFVPFDPEAVPTPNPVYSDPASTSVISDRIDNIFNNLQSSVTGSDLDFVLEYPTLPDWANVYNVNTFVLGDVGSYYGPYYYKGSQILWKYHDNAYLFDIEQFIYDNAVSSFFDVIIIRIDDTEWGTFLNNNSIPESTTFLGYVVLYTNNYYTRLDSETSINILQAIQLDANQQLSNWSWLVSRLDDFETQSLQALNLSNELDTSSLSWLKTIDNSIKSLDFPDFDDSSILSGLASIVSALSGNDDDLGVNGRLDKLINFFVANDAEPNESALTYRNWLDGLDPTETRRVTHFGTNIYSLVKNIFDIFDADYTEDPSFENPDKDYLDIASDYIDALNNRNNTNKFFRGFFDSSFDPLDQSGLPE